MRCDFCKKDFEEKAEKNITYIGIDEHHNPPQFLMEKWEGEIYNLCRKHHRELHDEIIKILNKVAGTLKFIKSEYWVCQRMSPRQKEEARKIIYEFTKRWIENGEKLPQEFGGYSFYRELIKIKEDENGDTNTTSKT